METKRIAFSRGLRRLCEHVGIDYKSPHKIRHGFGAFAVKHAKDYEQFKAYSKNMEHASVAITDQVYGDISAIDVKSIITSENPREVKTESNQALYLEFQAFLEWRDGKSK